MKYKALLGLTAAIIISLSADKPKREFEGTIIYNTFVESKTPDFTSAVLQAAYGDFMVLHYKNGNYKMTYSGNDIKAIYYLKSKNTMYTLRKGIDTLFTTLCDVELRSLVSSTHTSSGGEVLKKKCGMVVNDMGDVRNSYWFDPAIYVSPDQFKQHAFGHVNVYFEKAKAFWIKYKFEAPLLNVTHTATKIKRTTIPDNTFELPQFPHVSTQ